MKYIYMYIFVFLFPCFTHAASIPHHFNVSTEIDTVFFSDNLIITGENGTIPIDDGELFVNKDGTFTSSEVVLEAHKIYHGVIESNKYLGDTLWSLAGVVTFIDSEVKNIDLKIDINGNEFKSGNKYTIHDSDVSLNVENKNKILGLSPGQTIATELTIMLEPKI
ncbi:TPA: hypothetical protein ACX6SG_003812 [Photobacterium damselae]